MTVGRDDYMNGEGERTLRAYSVPVDLPVSGFVTDFEWVQAVFGEDWAVRRGNVFEIAEHMDVAKHFRWVRGTVANKCTFVGWWSTRVSLWRVLLMCSCSRRRWLSVSGRSLQTLTKM